MMALTRFELGDNATSVQASFDLHQAPADIDVPRDDTSCRVVRQRTSTDEPSLAECNRPSSRTRWATTRRRGTTV